MVGNLQAVIATNRFGLGARPGELDTVKSDPRGWLKAQLNGARPVPVRIKNLSPSDEIFRAQIAALRERLEAQKVAADSDSSAKPGAGLKRNVIVDNFLEQAAARYQVATHSTESFRERLVHFWANHFAVSMDKAAVAAMAGTLENEAIRPNLHLSFYDLLLAAEGHPAMILYLDNQLSMGPNSQLAQLAKRRASQQRKFDINENLGREILELHTLGVSGGYTQTDVTQFATALTGWSIVGEQGGFAAANRLSKDDGSSDGKFLFREGLHEPGTQTVLGKRYNQSGIDQPRAILKDLSRHPATADFIATKLARHFIADEPPAAAVSRIAKAFRDSEGHLPTVHAAVVDSVEAWASTSAKFKTPHEFIVSTFRALDYLPDQPLQIRQSFELLGQAPFSPGSPAGWPDIAGRWDGPDALMKRIEWATQVAQKLGGRISPVQLAERSLGDGLGEHTRMALSGAADGIQGTTLWLVSPEFQRR